MVRYFKDGCSVSIICHTNGKVSIFDVNNSFHCEFEKDFTQSFIDLLVDVFTNDSIPMGECWNGKTINLGYFNSYVKRYFINSGYYYGNSILKNRIPFILQCLEKRFKGKYKFKKNREFYSGCSIKYLKELLKEV